MILIKFKQLDFYIFISILHYNYANFSLMESLQDFLENWEKQSSLQVPISEVDSFKINGIK